MRKPVAVLFVLSLAVLALALVPAAGLAAKGGNGGGAKPGGGGGHGGGGKKGGGSASSSLTLVMVADANGNGSPNWDDTITFDVSTTATPYPYVQVLCYQDGTLVYSASAGFYDGYLWPGARNMPLSSPAWTGGAASCSAVLNSDLAILEFSVGA